MLASGLPEKSTVHAKNIALVALDMLDIVREITVDDDEAFRVQVRTLTVCHLYIIVLFISYYVF